MPSNPERTATTKTALLAAATNLLRSRGIAALTLQGVAQHAGISKGALTHHYPSKEALLSDLLEHHLNAFNATLQATQAPFAVAYVRHGTHDGSRGLALGLIAALVLNPDVLEIARSYATRWQEATPSTDALVARLATDGLWLADVLDLPSAPPELHAQLLTRLEELAGGSE
ncbi:TetR/AcrR family transcriptional regulator [Deinococcus oregonensis]|uniref:TetR/AcrR family transcriptional regulator n=1 Tax=Deinococcus oregonensis TaxID=1805970 RepID=A0ABV6B4Y0_9DEIO